MSLQQDEQAVANEGLDAQQLRAGVQARGPLWIKEIVRGDAQPRSLEETREALYEMARRKSGAFPAEVLVEQALAVSEDSDWACQRAALDALLRRLGFGSRDDLAIVERPDGNRLLGRYKLARRTNGKSGATKSSRGRRERRPYCTELHSIKPLQGSCDCPDFLTGSLGLCKHVLAVAEEVLTGPRKLPAALAEQERAAGPELRWNPIRNWQGPGDPLTGLRLDLSNSKRDGRALRGVLVKVGGYLADGQPKPDVLESLEQRAAFLETVERLCSKGKLDAEAAALALVHNERTRAERRLHSAEQAPTAKKHLKSLKRKLYPYQLEGIERFLSERRLLLADDMGLGKTTQAVAACHALYCTKSLTRGVVIAPASLKGQWVREWEATTSKVPVTLVEGSAKEREELYRNAKTGFLVMNYEQLLRDLAHVQRFAPQMVVLDEAQRIKNWATKSSTYVKSLQPEWRLVLTGTPMENRLEELATILDWIDEQALAPKWRLVPWHTVDKKATGHAGARNLDTLRQRLQHCLVRRVRKEVLRQLPPRTDVRVPVEMTRAQAEEHDALKLPIAQLMNRAKRRPLMQAEFLRLMQLLTQQRLISNGMELYAFDELWPTYSRSVADERLLSSMSSPKLLEFRRLIDELVIQQGRKVVVFSQWRKMLRLAEWSVRGPLSEHGLRSVFFTGAESQKQRGQGVEELHEDPDTRVMFLSDAGGVGLNLQRAANACINLELPWNPAVLEQRIGRIYRIGQESPIDIMNLVNEQGIESRIAIALSTKQALFSGLFDGTTDEIRFDEPSSFLSQVERIVEPPETVLPEDSDNDSEDSFEVDADTETDEAADLAADSAGESDFRDHATAAESDGTAGESEQAALSEAGADMSEAQPSQSSNATQQTSGPAELEARSSEAGDNAAESGAPQPASAAALFAQLKLTRTASGGVQIEAPAEAAKELAGVLEGLAGLLRQAGTE